MHLSNVNQNDPIILVEINILAFFLIQKFTICFGQISINGNDIFNMVYLHIIYQHFFLMYFETNQVFILFSLPQLGLIIAYIKIRYCVTWQTLKIFLFLCIINLVIII